MATQTTILHDDADRTDFRDVNDTGSVVLRTVWKSGSQGFNQQQLQATATSALATLATARTLLQGGGAAWDNATAAQRTTLMLALVNQNSALIRLLLGILDQPS